MTGVAADELARFTTAVETHLGIRVADRGPVMTEILKRRSARHASVHAYISVLEAADPQELRELVTEVSIGETYFFRHAEQCQAYADLVPQIAAEKGHVKVLSAGCSSGEEPYTLAILARERLPDPNAVSVRAFDLNPAALAKAHRARYSRWALRATSDAQERRWFVSHGREVEVAAEIKRAIAFSETNLLSDGSWSHDSFDLIFCRNVIMYFSEDNQRAVVARLVRALAPGGYLFLGHAETLRTRPPELELCHTHGTFYYRRGKGRTAAAAAPIAKPMRTEWVADIASAAERVTAIVGTALALPAREAVAESPLLPIHAMICEERFAEATAALAALPALTARDGEARLYGAIVQTHTGAAASAEATCRELIEGDPRAAGAHYVLALCRASAGDPLGAEHHALEALAIDPGFAMACVQLAFLARRAGARAHAATLLARAIAAVEAEQPDRFALFAGGFSRATLVALLQSELAAVRGAA